MVRDKCIDSLPQGRSVGRRDTSGGFVALLSRCSRRPLADATDEPDQPGAVFGCVQRMGARDLAGPAQSNRHRRQDLAPQP
jgi:hypothetical protein